MLRRPIERAVTDVPASDLSCDHDRALQALVVVFEVEHPWCVHPVPTQERMNVRFRGKAVTGIRQDA
jgi:hypothetical protein